MVVVQSSSQIVVIFIIGGFNSTKNTRDQIWWNKISKTEKTPTIANQIRSPSQLALGSPDPVVEGAAQFVALVPETHKLVAIGIGVFPSVLAKKKGWPDETMGKQWIDLDLDPPNICSKYLKMCKKVLKLWDKTI